MIGSMRRGVMLAALAFALSALPAAGQESGSGGAPAPVKREMIPGSELMTSQEREQYRQRIRAAKTPETEQNVRDDHYRRMQERARLRGLRLPDRGEPAGRAR